MEGIQQLAWIQSLPSNTVYVLLLLTMKNEVGIVLRPTVSSTLRTPIASDGCPLNSLSIMLVLIRSAEEQPNRRSTEYGIRLTAAPVSTNILFTGLPLMKPLRYNPAARWPIPPVGVPETPMGAQTPCSHQPMASHRLLSAWGATLFLEGAFPPFAVACLAPRDPDALSSARQDTLLLPLPDCASAVLCASASD